MSEVHASTSAEKSVWMTAEGMNLSLGDVRRLVEAAVDMSDQAVVKVSGFWGEGDSRYFKRMNIHDYQQIARAVVDVQAVSS